MKTTTRIGIVVVIGASYFIVELAMGFRTGSLALIADAFHYLNDMIAYIIAFIAAYLHENGKNSIGFTYAFQRADLVGAFFNGVFLLALAISIMLQTIERFVRPQPVEEPVLVLIVGCIGVVLNVLSLLVLHDHGHGGHSHGHSHSHGPSPAALDGTEINLDLVGPATLALHAGHNHTTALQAPKPARSLGVSAVMLHLFGDVINNIGVIITAVLLWKLESPERFYADPAMSLAISLVIFASAIPLTLKSGRYLLEAAPVHLDLEKVTDDLLKVPTVLAIHDLHVWHLSQSVVLASLHVCVPLGTSMEEWELTESELQHCFSAYGVKHVTISPELHRNAPPDTPRGSESEEEFGTCAMPRSKEGAGCFTLNAKGPVRRRRDEEAGA